MRLNEFLDESPAERPASNGDIDGLINAIRHVESGGNKNALSPQGASGSMQIMPGTFRQYARDGESYNNDEHRTNAAIRKIQDDYDYYGGDINKTAAAYIGGRGAILKDGSIRSDVKDAHGTSPLAYARMVTGRIGKQPAGEIKQKPVEVEDEFSAFDKYLSGRVIESDSPAAPVVAEKKSDAGIFGTLKSGVKGTIRAIGAIGDLHQGDNSDLALAAKSQQLDSANQDPALAALKADIQSRKERIGSAASWLETGKEVLGAMSSNLKGAGLFVAEQLPNSAAALGAGWAGAKVGAAVGTAVTPGIGTVIGGGAGFVTGMFGANYALEGGNKAIESAANGPLSNEDFGRIKQEGATKAGIITAVDALTFGIGGKLAGTAQRAVDRAGARVLSEAGVDVADRGAVSLAIRNNPALIGAVKEAEETAFKAATTLGGRVTQGVSGLSLETFGEGLGEYVGEGVATGKWDKMDAMLEAFSSIGQSGAETSYNIAKNTKNIDDVSMFRNLTQQPPTPTPIDVLASTDLNTAIATATASVSAPINTPTPAQAPIAPINPEIAALTQEAESNDQSKLLADVVASLNPTGTLTVSGKNAADAVRSLGEEIPFAKHADGSVLVSARFAEPVSLAIQQAQQLTNPLEQTSTPMPIPATVTSSIEPGSIRPQTIAGKSAETYTDEQLSEITQSVTTNIDTRKGAAIELQARSAENQSEQVLDMVQVVEQKKQAKVKKSGLQQRDDLVGAIMRVTGNKGIAANMAQDITGDTANRVTKLRGLFTNDGTADLGDTAMLLREQEGFDVRDAEHLSELIRDASDGNMTYSMERNERDAAANVEKEYKNHINERATELGLKKVGGKRTLAVVESDIAREEAKLDKLEENASFAESLVADAIDDAIGIDMTESDWMAWMSSDLAGTYTTEEIQRAEEDRANREDARSQAYADEFAGEQAKGDSRQGNGDSQAATESGRVEEGARGTAEEGLTLTGETNEEAAANSSRKIDPNALTKEEINAQSAGFGLQQQEGAPKPGPVQDGLRFSRVSDAPKGEELVAIHNLSAENVLHAASIGGIPVPSIGITKSASPFTGFGEITLIASNDMIDPDRSVPVFDRDAYTARFPTLNYKKVTAKKADDFYERMNVSRDLGDDGSSFMSQLWDAVKNDRIQSPDKLSRLFQTYTAPRMLYAKEVLGKEFKVPMRPIERRTFFGHEKSWRDFVKKNAELKRADDDAYNKAAAKAIKVAADEFLEREGRAELRSIYMEEIDRYSGNGVNWNYLDRAIKDATDFGKKRVDAPKLVESVDKVVKQNDPAYLKWISEQVSGLFQEPTITLRGREVSASLDNIVEAMTIGATSGAEKTMTFGVGKTSALLGKRFKSIEEIKQSRDQVISNNLKNQIKSENEKLLEDYRMKAVEFYTGKDWRGKIDTFSGFDDAMEALTKAGKMALTDGNIRLALQSKKFRGVSNEVIELARQSIDAIRSASTEYFEAKPQRAVKLREFKGAVVPKGTDPEVIAALENSGLTIVQYNSKSDGDRAAKVEKLAKSLNRVNKNVLFSNSSNATPSTAITEAEATSAITSKLGNAAKVLIDAGQIVLVRTEEGLRNLAGAKFMTAWHGSPHDHDKFDSSKIGTGEGAQAYGYGLYFAGDKSVAEWYKNALAKPQIALDGEPLKFQYDDFANALRNILRQVKKGTSFYDAIDDEASILESSKMPSRMSDAQRLRGLKEGSVGEANAGKLYQVELAPSEDQYLDWDKPLSEQSELVQKAIRPIVEQFADDVDEDIGVFWNDFAGTFYRHLADSFTQKSASDDLLSAGIRGIRYLDGNSRGASINTPSWLGKEIPDSVKSGSNAVFGNPGGSRDFTPVQSLLKKVDEFIRSGLAYLPWNEITPSQKDQSYSLIGNAKLLSNVTKTSAFIKHGFGGLDVPTKRVVLNAVSRVLQNRKVLDSVIKSVPVDVMNMLGIKEASTKEFFHDIPMLLNLLSINGDQLVPSGVNSSSGLVAVIADAAAKEVLSFDNQISGFKDFISTLLANDIWHNSSFEKGNYNSILNDEGNNYVIFSDDDVSITAKFAKEQGAIQGATLPDGRIVLVLENLNKDNIGGVLEHEGFHSSIRQLLGEKTYQQLMDRLGQLSKLNKSWAAQAEKSIPTDTKPENWLEEIGAYAIEVYNRGEQLPGSIRKWVEDFLSAIRSAIISSKHMPERAKLMAMKALKPQDLSRLAIAGLKAKANGIQTQGREAMAYSQIEQNALAAAWRNVSKRDDVFRFQISDSKDMEQVIKDVATGFETGETFSDFETEHSVKFWPKGHPEKSGWVTQYKQPKMVVLNVPNLDEGDNGAAMYAAVGNYAHNNNIPFHGDTFGVSKTAASRRLEFSISHALKYGSSETVKLSTMQKRDFAIDWIEGNDNHNLSEMLNASYRQVKDAAPEIDSATMKDVYRITKKARDAGLPVGESTIRRAIITAQVNQRGVDAIAEFSDEDTKKILYSKINQTSTAAFKKWFGNSAVVDVDGKPLAMYHGTGNLENLAAFDPSLTGKGNDQIGSGFYFTTKPEEASGYATSVTQNAGNGATKLGGDSSPGVAKVWLSIKKPIVIKGSNLVDSDVSLTHKQATEIIKRAPGIRDLDDSPLGDHIDIWSAGEVTDKMISDVAKLYTGHSLISLEGDMFRNGAEEYRKALYDVLGYDGVVQDFGNGHKHYVAWFPEQVKSATGNNGNFDGSNPDIRYSRAAVNQPSATLPEETKAEAAQRKVQDKFNRFTAVKDWLKSHGLTLSPLADVYRAEERYHGRVATRIEDFREKTINPIIQKVQAAGFTMVDVADFLEAQHTAEANAQIQKITGDATATAAGITDADAATYLAKATPELATLANEFRDITNKTRDLLLKNGIITQEMADAWEATYQHYVPLKGGQDEVAQRSSPGSGMSVNAKQKRRLGHGKRDEHVVENIMRDHERAIVATEKNLVGQYMLKMALEVSALDPDLITINQPEKRKVLMPGKASYVVEYNGSVIESFENRNDANRFVQTMGKSGMKVTKSVGDPHVQMMAAPMLQENEATVYLNGHAVRVQINDPILAQQYKNLGVEQLNAVLSAARGLNNWLSKAYTGYNPEFILVNMARDFTGGMINLTGNYGVGMASKALANYPKAFKEVLRYAITGNASADVQQYRDNGGSTGSAYLSDIERVGKDVEAAYNEYVGVAENTKQGNYWKATRAAGRKLILNGLLKWVNHLNAASENAMRVATFVAVRDKTGSVAEAASAAKNVTVNFNRKGESGSTIGALYLFANPNIQGTAALYKALFRGEYKSQAWTLVGGMMALAAMMAMQFDDDEWEKIPEYEKDRNLLIRVGDKRIKIPVPYGYGFFFGLGNVYKNISAGDSPMKVSTHLASSFFEHFSPLGNPIQSPITMLPTAIKIPMEPALNVNDFGRKIVPENQFNENKPDFLKMNRTTKGGAADAIARELNELSGGTKATAGKADVSPETLKYWWKTLTGGTGAFFTDVARFGGLTSDGATPDLHEIPLIRKFASEGRVSDSRSVYYQKVDEAKKAWDAFHTAQKERDQDGMDKLKGEKELFALAKASDRSRSAVKALRDRQDAILQDESKTLAERRLEVKLLERKEEELYQRVLNSVK